MTSIIDSNDSSGERPHSSSDSKTHALIAYVLMTIGFFTAIPMFVGAIWAMFTRKNAHGTLYHSHYTNAIRVFWWSLLWAIIGWATAVFMVGFAILGIAWLWGIYRIIYGLAKIMADEPYPL